MHTIDEKSEVSEKQFQELEENVCDDDDGMLINHDNSILRTRLLNGCLLDKIALFLSQLCWRC